MLCTTSKSRFHLAGPLTLLAAATFLLQACGGSGAGTCNVTVAAANYGYCIDYLGSSYTASSIQSSCSAAGGSYSTAACPASNEGTCDLEHGTSAEIEWYFTSGTGLQTVCTAGGGTFSTGGNSGGGSNGGSTSGGNNGGNNGGNVGGFASGTWAGSGSLTLNGTAEPFQDTETLVSSGSTFSFTNYLEIPSCTAIFDASGASATLASQAPCTDGSGNAYTFQTGTATVTGTTLTINVSGTSIPAGTSTPVPLQVTQTLTGP